LKNRKGLVRSTLRDIVAGFGKTSKEVLATVRRFSSWSHRSKHRGFIHATKKLYPVERQIENVKALRKLAETTGVPLVINARTDALRFADGDEEARIKEAFVEPEYQGCGADCVYRWVSSMRLLSRDS